MLDKTGKKMESYPEVLLIGFKFGTSFVNFFELPFNVLIEECNIYGPYR